MSQRGGSVFSHVRFGEKVYSPVIPENQALYDEVLVEKSKNCRAYAEHIFRENDKQLIEAIRNQSRENLKRCVAYLIEKGKMQEAKGEDGKSKEKIESGGSCRGEKSPKERSGKDDLKKI